MTLDEPGIRHQRRSLCRCLGETWTAPTPRPQRGQPHVDGPLGGPSQYHGLWPWLIIHAYTNLHGYAPAESEIAAATCISPPSVNQMVKVLEKKGLIDRQPGQPRSIRVRVPDDEIPRERSQVGEESGASSQPTEPRCSGPGVASDELVRRIGLLAEWTYQ